MAPSRSIKLDQAAQGSLHLLQQCKISLNGEAPISEYFKSEATGANSDGLPVLASSFRGRTMKGRELVLPENAVGYVLEPRERALTADDDNDDDDNHDSSPPSSALKEWHATHKFNAFTYWNHDTVPTSTDGVQRAMEWGAIAAALHAPVSAADITAAASELQNNTTISDGQVEVK